MHINLVWTDGLTDYDRLEVIPMFSEVWGWVTTFMAEFQKSTERVREWTKHNMERRKEINRKAAKTYYDKNKENPEFMDKRREQKAEWARKNYKPVSELTPEELEEKRAKTREAVKRYRERQKLKNLQEAANEEKGKSPEA